MKIHIKCTYGGHDEAVDNIIMERMKEIGAEWYAQGFNFDSQERDICFYFDIHTPPNHPTGGVV